jgi:TolB protein
MKKMVYTLSIIFVLCSLLVILPVSADIYGKIAFSSNRTGNYDIWVMNPDGSGQTDLTNNPALDDTPAWSPDGSKIAFVSKRPSSPYHSTEREIYVMNADGSGQTQLTRPASYHTPNNYDPAWSPDGSKIAFVSTRDSTTGYNAEIYVMNADGTGQKRLTNNPSIDDSPTWSPDGSKIAFESRTGENDNYKIWVMNADGSGQPKQLTFNNAYEDGYPAWSPNGTKIAFDSNRAGVFEIYVMNTDGTEQTLVATSTFGNEYHPTWSPDGSSIAFWSFLDANFKENHDIYVMNTNGQGLTRLTTDLAKDEYPAWGRFAQNSLETPVRCGTGGTKALYMVLKPITCGDNYVEVYWGPTVYNPFYPPQGEFKYYNVWKAKDSSSGPVAPFTYYEPPLGYWQDWVRIIGPVDTFDIILTPVVQFSQAGGELNPLIPVCYQYIKVTPPTCQVSAKVSIQPDPLNIASKGYFMAFITLPKEYKASDVDAKSVVCNGVSAQRLVRVSSFKQTFAAIFSRDQLENMKPGNAVPFTLSGIINKNGQKIGFSGSTSITVISNKGKPKEEIDDVDKMTDMNVFNRFNPR